MGAGLADHITIVISKGTLTGDVPGSLAAIVESDRHIVAGNRVDNAFTGIIRQAEKAAAADVGIDMRTVECDRLVIDKPGDGEVIEGHGHDSAGITPYYTLCNRDDDRTGTGTIHRTVGAVIGNRDRAGIVYRIDRYNGIANGRLYGIVVAGAAERLNAAMGNLGDAGAGD